ncbi:translation initiation factor IF-2 [Luteibaculum oceani]|uniref:Translation initiation factor IF-2 n=1 Tax=Luteibaculum oceani TaxID=1294296 RepID=A0A5C6VPG2_9FLAO|nr:translation initiation factor IF-2 [Luteibaculum oceani]TXC85078.1 translation initiation factor IF-2 [Luteibaculum oceani]
MSETKVKPARLSKVAKDCNVSLSTVVDFLGKKGVEIDAKPNTKLDPEHYEMVLKEFMPDLLVKQASKQETIARQPKETVALDYMEEKSKPEPEAETEAESTDDAKAEKADNPSEETTEEKAEVVQETVESTEEPAKEEPVAKAEPEVAKEEPKVEVEKVEEKVEEAKSVPKAAEVEKEPEVEAEAEAPAEAAAEEKQAPESNEEVADDGSGPRVVGKLDLANLNTKTRPSKKSREEILKEKKAGEKAFKEAQAKKEAERKVKEAEEAKQKAAEAESKKKEETPAKKEDDVIRAKVQKLSGPTVLGKMELPTKPEKKKADVKKVASSEDKAGNKKRKRKRINQPDQNQQRGRGGQGGNQRGGQRGKAREPKPELTEEQIQKEIKETLARLSSGGGKNKGAKFRRAKRDAISQKMEEEAAKKQAEQKILKVTEFVTVGEIASMMDVPVTQVISACMTLGIIAAINQRLDAETLTLICEEFGYKVEFVDAEETETVLEEEDNPDNLQPRSPIVTVMGHVDHGKTSLLDYIRSANVIAGEAGGITQHIGAYKVQLAHNEKEITFLDTPGHEAFTAMRARGAKVTDVAIIVVAADDAVMPQTKEAINHAQAAEVPMIFAINKIDKPGANPDKVREELAQMNILVEDWGGKFQCQEISAKQGTGIEELLDKVLLEAELLELKADPDKRAAGSVIESSLDKGKGYVVTMLVESGSMKVGDFILAGSQYGRIKAMHNERGQEVSVAGPSDPVSVLGLNGSVNAGDRFHIVEDEREAKQIAAKRQQLQREQGIRAQKHVTLDEIGRRLALGDFKELNLIVKGDVDGSIEALSDALLKLSNENIQVNIIHKAVGPISDSDVLLASASDAIIVGFQVRPNASAKKLAEKEEIEIRMYSIIYDAIAEIKDAMEGMLSPDIEERIVGTAEIRETFRISKVGVVAGCFVQEGKIVRNNKCRIIRDGIVIYEGNLGSLKRFQDDAKEVPRGMECGLNIDKFNDIKVGDIVESFEQVEVAKKL